MSGAIKQFRRHEVVQFVPTVKPVGLEMLPSVNAAMVGVLQQPGFEGSAIRIELPRGPEDIEKYLLDGLFRFPIIVEDCAGYSEDQRAVSLKQNGEGIVTAHA